MGEEGGTAAGVEEDDGGGGVELSRADVGDETGHGLAGVDGIEEDGFGAGEEANGFHPFRGRFAVAGADEVAVDDEIGFGEIGGEIEKLGSGIGERGAGGDQVLDRTLDGDAANFEGGGGGAGADDQAGLGAHRGGGVVEANGGLAEGQELGEELEDHGDVADGTEGNAAASGDDVGALAGGAQLVLDPFHGGDPGCLIRNDADLGAHQAIEEEVAGEGVAVASIENEEGAETGDSGGGGGHAGVVGLDGALGDKEVGAGGEGVGEEVFELAGLVAAEGETGQVVAFEIDARAGVAEGSFQVAGPHEGRGEGHQGIAGDGGEAHGGVLQVNAGRGGGV